MSWVPLPVVLPLLIAAVLAGVGSFIPRKLVSIIALLTAATVAGICIFLAVRSSDGTLVYWFGNWKTDPRSHFPIGVCFMVDPIGAGMAALASVLMFAAFMFSWTFLDSIKRFYHTLMLVFVAAMCGLCLTGDIFNLFVWLELMTAVGVGLCGYESNESQPLLGALNFAVMNTIGAFMTLIGIALLYARYGALNMAELASSIAAHDPGATFIAVAFIFVIAGFLVKAAAAPFHFWLADAHAVAPSPVCILFSGVMVELGLYAIARVYWVIFADSFSQHAEVVRGLFLTIGTATAVVGAIHCFGQRHFKRLLALSTVSHVGLMIIAFALLRPDALAGLAIYVVGHGLVKGCLFTCAGILLHRFRSVDEHSLRGRVKSVPLAILLLASALALAGLPPFATFYGQALIDDAADQIHMSWLCIPTVFAETLTAAAVLRVLGRLHFDWGKTREASSRGAPYIPMDSETEGTHEYTPLSMWIPAATLLCLAAILSLPSDARDAVLKHATHFTASAHYRQAVLHALPDPPVSVPHMKSPAISWRQGIVPIGALLLAAAALFPKTPNRSLNLFAGRVTIAFYRPLRRLQSGMIGDYVAWLVIGFAFYGIVLLFARR